MGLTVGLLTFQEQSCSILPQISLSPEAAAAVTPPAKQMRVPLGRLPLQRPTVRFVARL